MAQGQTGKVSSAERGLQAGGFQAEFFREPRQRDYRQKPATTSVQYNISGKYAGRDQLLR
jgi:hypothetical protein